MHNPAPVLENNTHKFLWDFGIHTGDLRRLAVTQTPVKNHQLMLM